LERLLQLRRVFLIGSASALLALPVGRAEGVLLRTSGGVQVGLEDGHGFAKLRSRGTLLGRIRRGRVVATENVFVGHWTEKRRVFDRLIAYRGRRMTLRVFSGDGAWVVRLRGGGINVSGVVRGSLTVNGVNSGPTGRYTIDGGAEHPWPRSRRTFQLDD
jgi:hypothetical protein